MANSNEGKQLLSLITVLWFPNEEDVLSKYQGLGSVKSIFNIIFYFSVPLDDVLEQTLHLNVESLRHLKLQCITEHCYFAVNPACMDICFTHICPDSEKLAKEIFFFHKNAHEKNAWDRLRLCCSWTYLLTKKKRQTIMCGSGHMLETRPCDGSDSHSKFLWFLVLVRLMQCLLLIYSMIDYWYSIK